MILHCIKCSIFKKYRNIEIKHEIDGKINFYSRCIYCGFKKLETIEEEELINLLKV